MQPVTVTVQIAYAAENVPGVTPADITPIEFNGFGTTPVCTTLVYPGIGNNNYTHYFHEKQVTIPAFSDVRESMLFEHFSMASGIFAYTIRVVCPNGNISFDDQFSTQAGEADIYESNPGQSVLLSNVANGGMDNFPAPGNEYSFLSGVPEILVFLEGKLVIDVDYDFPPAWRVFIKPNSNTVIENGAKLTIDGASLEGCEALWESVEVRSGGELSVNAGPPVGNPPEPDTRPSTMPPLPYLGLIILT